VSLDPTAGNEPNGSRPVLVVSPAEFNEATKLPVILPITKGGEFARRLGFARARDRHQNHRRRSLRSTARNRPGRPRARKVDTLPEPIMDEVLAKIATLFE
jgi:mRNA interferase ChpB